jgi:ATP-dependent RNA helicase RhlB
VSQDIPHDPNATDGRDAAPAPIGTPADDAPVPDSLAAMADAADGPSADAKLAAAAMLENAVVVEASAAPVTDMSFSALHLPEVLARGIADAGFERCTPIQAGTLPHALAGKDVAGQAQTGTGKTAAFLISMYAHLLRHPAPADKPSTSPRAFILAPTRELAVQIHKDAELLGQYTGLTLGLAFGGVDYEKQRRTLEAGVDVLIGTPGRIIDYFKQRVFELRHVQVMILDEADRMFDLGFIADIRYLMRRLPAPQQRLSMLFSATLAQRVLELAYEHMNEPVLIKIEPEKVTADKVRQVIYFPSMDEKVGLLVGLLKKLGATRTMVFVNMKRTAERLEATLRANGIDAEAMSGDVPQNKRLRMLQAFHDGKLAVLIATDVAARGLHIPDVTHVFNYDLPQDPEDYVHRIGRTARAGAAGDAISFGCEDYVQSLPDIEDFIGRKLPVEKVEPELLAEVVHVDGPGRYAGGGPRGGRRGGGGGGGGGGFRGGRGPGGPGGRGGPPRGPRPDRPPAPLGVVPGAAPAEGVAVAAAAGSPGGPSDAPRGDRPPRRDRDRGPRRPGDGPREGMRPGAPDGARDGRRPDGAPGSVAAANGAAGAPVVPGTEGDPGRKRRRRRRGGRGRNGPKTADGASTPAAENAGTTTNSPGRGTLAIAAVAALLIALVAWIVLRD